MKADKAGPTLQKGGLSYGELYRLLREKKGLPEGGQRESGKAREAAPLRWDQPELVTMFKRLGTVPGSYTPKRAALRVVLAVSEMARANEAPIEEVYATLAQHCDSKRQDAVCIARPRCHQCPAKPHCTHASRRPTIKDLPETERPRERLLAIGERHMSNAELLAIIIGGGSKEESALALAQRLLSIFGSLHGVAEAGTRELEDVKGIGKAKIAHIRAAFALGRRLSAEPVSKGAAMKGSQEVVRQFGERLKDLKKEVFLCLLLDTKHNIILEDPIAEGSLDETVVHPREVFKRAVKESASAVLFVHNHPSGNPEPSAQDRRLTQRLCEVGNLVGIPVLDHLIIARDGYYSFAEHGGIRT